MNFKEHDVVRLTADDYEFDTHSEGFDGPYIPDLLPKGTEGTIVAIIDNIGCYVEFPYIRNKYPDGDPVVWIRFNDLEEVK